MKQTAVEYLESSESEGEGDNAADGESKEEGKEEEEADRREEARVQKLWVKRAKRRRVLAEVEQSAAGGDSQGPELLMQEVGKALFVFFYRWCRCPLFSPSMHTDAESKSTWHVLGKIRDKSPRPPLRSGACPMNNSYTRNRLVYARIFRMKTRRPSSACSSAPTVVSGLPGPRGGVVLPAETVPLGPRRRWAAMQGLEDPSAAVVAVNGAGVTSIRAS